MRPVDFSSSLLMPAGLGAMCKQVPAWQGSPLAMGTAGMEWLRRQCGQQVWAGPSQPITHRRKTANLEPICPC